MESSGLNVHPCPILEGNVPWGRPGAFDILAVANSRIVAVEASLTCLEWDTTVAGNKADGDKRLPPRGLAKRMLLRALPSRFRFDNGLHSALFDGILAGLSRVGGATREYA